MNVIYMRAAAAVPNFKVLQHYGEMLDEVEAGLTAISAPQYQRMVLEAHDFISSYWGHAQLSRICNQAGALQDMYHVVGREKQVSACVRALSSLESSRV